MRGWWRPGAVGAALSLLLVGCSPAGPVTGPATSAVGSPATTAPATGTTTTPATTSTTSATATTSTAAPTPAGPWAGDGTPRRATLGIPTLELAGLVVEPYAGWTDDGPGTAIQDRGLAASPYGPRGGTGPGGIGNYQVTAHRTTPPAPFRNLPALAEGQLVTVDAGGTRYTYQMTATRQTSFRSAASLAEQRAAVPGRPGVAPSQAMITVSTCLTPEDHAAGNHWADENDNPEHRVDKVGVLVATGPAPA